MPHLGDVEMGRDGLFIWQNELEPFVGIEFEDGFFGKQRFVAGRDFGDFVVWREDGVPSYQLAVVADDAERELGAACAFLRRRRAGPFGEADELKVLAAMGRGGFAQEVARRAMLLERDEAERLIKRLHE